jgi:hypothetical protein
MLSGLALFLWVESKKWIAIWYWWLSYGSDDYFITKVQGSVVINVLVQSVYAIDSLYNY